MAKRVTKKNVNTNEMDGKEFFEAIHQIEQEKGIKPIPTPRPCCPPTAGTTKGWEITCL